MKVTHPLLPGVVVDMKIPWGDWAPVEESTTEPEEDVTTTPETARKRTGSKRPTKGTATPKE